MCITPNFVWVRRGPKWEQTPAPCKLCWQCKENRVNDFCGRSLAEAQTSEVCCVVNMTYAPRGDLADKILNPEHFQLFMKRLRRAGHFVRYLVAGEYGSEKGRSHFHAILFFSKLVPLQYRDDKGLLITRGCVPRYQDDYPSGVTQDDAPFCRDIPHQRMVHLREWPHGHITVDWSISEKSVRYVCKYLFADDKNNAWFSMSKKPALGSAWFAQKAQAYREGEVMPRSFEYTPPGGKPGRAYLMTGATRRDFILACEIEPERRCHMSEWVQRTFDKQERARVLDELNAVAHLVDFQRFNPQQWVNEHDRHYVLWWLDRVREGIDQPFDWCYDHSPWVPFYERSGYGTSRINWKDRGVFNKKPRPPVKSVSGYLRCCCKASRIAARSTRRDIPGQKDSPFDYPARPGETTCRHCGQARAS